MENKKFEYAIEHELVNREYNGKETNKESFIEGAIFTRRFIETTLANKIEGIISDFVEDYFTKTKNEYDEDIIEYCTSDSKIKMYGHRAPYYELMEKLIENC